MKENAIGTMVVDGAVELHRDLGAALNLGEALMRDGITRIIHGTLDADPPSRDAFGGKVAESDGPTKGAGAPGKTGLKSVRKSDRCRSENGGGGGTQS